MPCSGASAAQSRYLTGLGGAQVLTSTKAQAHERAAKRVSMDQHGSEASFLSLRPAFKVTPPAKSSTL